MRLLLAHARDYRCSGYEGETVAGIVKYQMSSKCINAVYKEKDKVKFDCRLHDLLAELFLATLEPFDLAMNES